MSTQGTCLKPCKKIRKRCKKSIQSTNSQVSLPEGSSQGMTENIATKDSTLHKSVFQDVVQPDKLQLAYYSGGMKLLLGRREGSRIFCYCCNEKVSASKFEAHAGFASRRKPYSYIRVVSTGELLSDSKNRQRADGEVAQRHDNDGNECNESGAKLNCSGCLKFFHREFASLEQPGDKWLCTSCINLTRRDCDADNIIVQTSKSYEVQTRETKCCLCSKTDFSKSQFDGRTILLCDQCEREYHVDCLKEKKLADLKELPEGNWFCCSGCREVHLSLLNLLGKGEQELRKNVVSSRKHLKEDTKIAVRFRLLKGPLKGEEISELLSQAISVLEEGFGHISYGSAGLIHPLVYGKKIRDQQFRGMHCAVLLVNSEVVSAAVFRLFGQEFAELPLIATLHAKQGRGYFSAIFNEICRLCISNEVKKILLPATVDAEKLWINLGFKSMTPTEVSAQLEFFPDIVQFRDVVMLEKTLSGLQLPDTTTDAQVGTSAGM